MILASPAYGRFRNSGLVPDEGSGTYIAETCSVVAKTESHIPAFAAYRW